MKKLLIIVVAITSSACFSQRSNEFKVYDNGLIYSETAVSKLKHIVDSLNLKFKKCDLSKKYFSKATAKAHYISLESSKAKQMKLDIDAGLNFEEILKKYPKADVSSDELIFCDTYPQYDEKDVLVISNFNLGKNKEFELTFEDKKNYKDVLEGKWIYQYHEKTDYSEEAITAIYLIEDFQTKELPEKYSKLIQYSDCLIDTTATVFNKNAMESGVRYFDTIPNKIRKFNNYVNETLKRPSYKSENMDVLFAIDTSVFAAEDVKPAKLTKKEKQKLEKLRLEEEKKFENFMKKREAWEDKRLIRLDSLKVADSNFMKNLIDAHEEAKEKGGSDDEFEEYVERFISKESALELKRSRKVIGGCSMDISPRIHAQNIALLSAETTKWEIFLQSHLNIMNDRFDRVSDGSWAQGERRTYIKEIEELNIDVQDLLLGISLRLENPSTNHYNGSIRRLGRAITESKDKVQFQNRILEMISDNTLDDYNRVLMYFLIKNCVYNLDNDLEKNSLNTSITKAVAGLPKYISSKMDIKE